MECMVKVVKPFYAIKCIVGWLAGGGGVGGGGGGGGNGCAGYRSRRGLWSVNMKWGFASC